jgi:hypothetical protein
MFLKGPLKMNVKSRKYKFQGSTPLHSQYKSHCWEAVMVGKFAPCIKKTLELYLTFVVFSNQMLILHRLLRIQGSLVKALQSKIIFLQWEGQKQPAE